MSDEFPGCIPTALRIAGTINEEIEGVKLEFPSGSMSYPDISFSDADLHEEYLYHFDEHGISVFLKVEPGFADVSTLIHLVLDRYKNHPCVIGFGVDAEWFENVTEGGTGSPVND